MGSLFSTYWTAEALGVNGVVLSHIALAFLLGSVIGYERTFHGHAAGMRTYALVAGAAAALVVVTGFPGHWYGGLADAPLPAADPTRVIQGLVTGIGFLGAGVIMKEGFSIRGLSTAADIWITAAIGVLVGLGFLVAAGATALATVVAMGFFRPLEEWLPHRTNVHLTLTFTADAAPTPAELIARVAGLGCRLIDSDYRLDRAAGKASYTLVVQDGAADPSARLVDAFSGAAGLVKLRLTPSRN